MLLLWQKYNRHGLIAQELATPQNHTNAEHVVLRRAAIQKLEDVCVELLI